MSAKSKSAIRRFLADVLKKRSGMLDLTNRIYLKNRFKDGTSFLACKDHRLARLIQEWNLDKVESTNVGRVGTNTLFTNSPYIGKQIHDLARRVKGYLLTGIIYITSFFVAVKQKSRITNSRINREFTNNNQCENDTIRIAWIESMGASPVKLEGNTVVLQVSF
ncbi:MAG: hypothetical protein NZO16_04020 [Deltaproteobacteria bacterium]|nr:hypothetical protein [Deltaproteobacteria bacterium]